MKIIFSRYRVSNLSGGEIMCFSAEASFTAALVLGIAGGATLKSCKSPALIPLAAVPLLFAVQQFAEGGLWLYFGKHLDSPVVFTWTMRMFLIFAFLIWPVWIPLALGLAEKPGPRRSLIFVDLAFGILLSGLNLSYALKQNITVEIMNHSIQYKGEIPPQLYIYPLIVLAPCFISSLKNMPVFGLLSGIAFFIAQYYYFNTFVSVWCFFSAIVSLCIYKVINDNQPAPISERSEKMP